MPWRGLNGMARRWVEIKLTALVEPDRLADAEWRRKATGGHPELVGLVLFERSLRATFDGAVQAREPSSQAGDVGGTRPGTIGADAGQPREPSRPTPVIIRWRKH